MKFRRIISISSRFTLCRMVFRGNIKGIVILATYGHNSEFAVTVRSQQRRWRNLLFRRQDRPVKFCFLTRCVHIRCKHRNGFIRYAPKLVDIWAGKNSLYGPPSNLSEFLRQFLMTNWYFLVDSQNV